MGRLRNKFKEPSQKTLVVWFPPGEGSVLFAGVWLREVTDNLRDRASEGRALRTLVTSLATWF